MPLVEAAFLSERHIVLNLSGGNLFFSRGRIAVLAAQELQLTRSLASEGTDVAGSGDREKKDRRGAAVSAQLVTAASLSTNENRQAGAVSTGHGDGCGKPLFLLTKD
jgi:hypothetical protein